VLRVLVLSAEDSVGVVLKAAAPGDKLALDSGELICLDPIPPGHKVALKQIPQGAKVLKFGVPIGSATAEIRPGEHVHTHNLASEYTPTLPKAAP
jgi:hypothetical protein